MSGWWLVDSEEKGEVRGLNRGTTRVTGFNYRALHPSDGTAGTRPLSQFAIGTAVTAS